MRQGAILQGESVDTLLQFLGSIKTSKERDGMVRVSADAPIGVAAAFKRAVMRREAQLLRADADQVDIGRDESRTHEQRRADAFVDVVTSIEAALKYFPSSQTTD
jgi:Domain of unknown function (DUF222)